MASPAPTSKQEFYGRYRLREFGNMPSSWESKDSLRESGFSGTVTARPKIAGGKCLYCLSVAEAIDLDWDAFYNESMPDDFLRIQGAVYRGESGIEMDYSLHPGMTMRDAMRKPLNASGSPVRLILESLLFPASCDDVFELLELYDGVVEFGAYSRTVGYLPNRNTVIWEVRNY